MASTVNSRGRVTIPKQVRDRLGIRAGSTVAFDLNDSGEVVLRCVAQADGQPASVPASRFAKLRGRATVKMRTEEIVALTRRSATR
jgi:AbrB family looped-hinge helix DNA binding protein